MTGRKTSYLKCIQLYYTMYRIIKLKTSVVYSMVIYLNRYNNNTVRLFYLQIEEQMNTNPNLKVNSCILYSRYCSTHPIYLILFKLLTFQL